MALAARAAAKTALVVTTLLCLVSMGGAMMVAASVLVPLHWLAGRDSGPAGTAGWALLAGLSVSEASWMWTCAATGSELGSAVVLVAGLLGAAVGFVLLRTRRLPPDPRPL